MGPSSQVADKRCGPSYRVSQRPATPWRVWMNSPAFVNAREVIDRQSSSARREVTNASHELASMPSSVNAE